MFSMPHVRLQLNFRVNNWETIHPLPLSKWHGGQPMIPSLKFWALKGVSRFLFFNLSLWGPRTCSQCFWTFVRPKYRPRMVPSFLNINSRSILYHQCSVITSWSTFSVLFFPPLWPPLRMSRKKKKALPSSKRIKEGTKPSRGFRNAVAISLTSLYGWCNHRTVALFSKLRALWFCFDHSACQQPFTPSSMYYVLSTFLHSKNEHTWCLCILWKRRTTLLDFIKEYRFLRLPWENEIEQLSVNNWLLQE